MRARPGAAGEALRGRRARGASARQAAVAGVVRRRSVFGAAGRRAFMPPTKTTVAALIFVPRVLFAQRIKNGITFRLFHIFSNVFLISNTIL